MYSRGVSYKFQTEDGMVFTGEILEEDAICIKIKTIRNETIILNKKSIDRSIEVKEGDSHGSQSKC